MIRKLLFCVFAAFLVRSASAQSFVLDMPLRSQKAEVSQRVGLTDITIRYHRPLVNGRTIWGGVVPYGNVWRTGANEITTIAFSDPVTIEGTPLATGTYGLHMIPNADEWTIIFSKNATSWGSFTYDQSEDALRVSVKPRPTSPHEALTFTFDDLRPDATTVALEWDRVAVPFHIGVDVHQLVQASFREQLRTLARYTWMSWDDAAGYLLAENIALEDALRYADKSIQNEDRFDNELTKSKVLAALHRDTESAAAQRRAIDLGTAAQVNGLAVQLLKAKHEPEALVLFRENATRHPREWVVHEGLARAYSAQGKFDEAQKEANAALAAAPEAERADLAALVKRLAAKEDINR